jgi:hypothetical protein
MQWCAIVSINGIDVGSFSKEDPCVVAQIVQGQEVENCEAIP